jgi:hypothetical protein
MSQFFAFGFGQDKFVIEIICVLLKLYPFGCYSTSLKQQQISKKTVGVTLVSFPILEGDTESY